MTGQARVAANLRRLADDIQKGGDLHIFVYNQASGPYCTVSGLGVHSGGYQTVDEAVEAWIEARDFLTTREAAVVPPGDDLPGSVA